MDQATDLHPSLADVSDDAHDPITRPPKAIVWEEWALAFVVIAVVANGLMRLLVMLGVVG